MTKAAIYAINIRKILKYLLFGPTLSGKAILFLIPSHTGSDFTLRVFLANYGQYYGIV
jgi:hypothetical protein